MKLDMVNNTNELYRYPLPKEMGDRALSYSSKPLSPTSGIVRFLKKPGEIVTKGEKIAKIYNEFGKKVETMYEQDNGIIIGHADIALAFPGSPLMAFGNIKKTSKSGGEL